MALLKRNRESEHRPDHDPHGETRHDTRATDSGHEHPARTDTRSAERRAVAYDRYGGINWGAAFFGWLVAVGVTALLAGIVGAVAAVADQENYTLDANAETLGLAAAITLVVLLSLAYFTGGYVAGRMSRYDGAKQGAAAWGVGLLVTLIAAALGAVAGSEYNILQQVDLPNIPLSQDELSTGGIITAVVVLALTLLASIAGGAAGRRYHAKVDRAKGI